jgi:hypothetical protein
MPLLIVNPLVTYRVRGVRQMGRDKRDVTDAEKSPTSCINLATWLLSDSLIFRLRLLALQP